MNYLVSGHTARQYWSWTLNPRVPVLKPCTKGILCRGNCIFKSIEAHTSSQSAGEVNMIGLDDEIWDVAGNEAREVGRAQVLESLEVRWRVKGSQSWPLSWARTWLVIARRSVVPLSEDGGYVSQDVFIGKSQELNSKGFKHWRKSVFLLEYLKVARLQGRLI